MTTIMLTGRSTVVTFPKVLNRTKRSLLTTWREDKSVYITWNREPFGIPDEHKAISEGWLVSDQLAAALPFWGAVGAAQSAVRNSRWANYLQLR